MSYENTDPRPNYTQQFTGENANVYAPTSDGSLAIPMWHFPVAEAAFRAFCGTWGLNPDRPNRALVVYATRDEEGRGTIGVLDLMPANEWPQGGA